MRTTLRICLLTLVLLPLAAAARAQGGPPADDAPGEGLRFNGYGRAYLQQAALGGTVEETDTLAVESIADGVFLLDLAANAQPNANTEVQGVLRLRNEFGGFFGSGVTVELRELWARGVVADVLRYHVGDMNLALTPYTLYLPAADGVVNEPEVFVPQREVIYYENFYTGLNERRLQGAALDFGLGFDRAVDLLDVRAFLTRLRTTDFFNTPSRYIGGGRLAATSVRFGPYRTRATLGVNLSHTWDDLDSGQVAEGLRNRVLTFDGDVAVLDGPALGLHLVGEAGESRLAVREDVSPAAEDPAPDGELLLDEDDTFVEVGVRAVLKERALSFTALFADVGPDFYSAAAQSKRIDYGRSKSLYNRIGLDRALRRVSLFDLTRDAGLYTYRVAEGLMTYDPRYNNTLPYGRATPNRRGVHLGAAYAPAGADAPLAGTLDLALLREIRGQGTEELKSFVLLRAAADLDVGAFLGAARLLDVSFGLQYENTSRDGEEVEAVDLASTLLELGVVAEVYDRLDVLGGVKYRTSSGRDYVPLIEDYNDVRDFPGPFVTDDAETLLGGGLRYRFGEGVHLTVQYQRFAYGDDATPEDDYRLGQVFALYTMAF